MLSRIVLIIYGIDSNMRLFEYMLIYRLSEMNLSLWELANQIEI